MAVTRKADVTNQIPTIWAADMFSQAENMTFWQKFEGPEGSSMPITRKDDLTKEAGDTIKTDIVLALTGAGLTGDTSGALLEGNEEALKWRQMSFTVDSLQHAVRWTKLGKILINHDMRTSAKNQLAKWYAGKLDDRLFNELTGQSGFTVMPDKNKWAAGTATTRDTIADTNAGGRLNLAQITEMRAYAETDLKIEPLVMADGEEYYGLVLHPYTAMSLKRDDTAWAQAQRDAQDRGRDNPVFTGALGMWDGVILYRSARVPRSNNATPIPVSDNVFFGAQAASRGYAYYPDWTEEYFSYGQEQGIATWGVHGQKLNVFDLTSGGGAAASALTAIGAMVVYASAPSPSQP
jgi:N4-gp56 family major capsid protein